MEICNKESSMSSFIEFWSLVFIHFKSLAPLSGQALVTDRLWAIADNFTRFENITLSNEMLHILVSNHSAGVFPGFGNPVQRTWGVLTQTNLWHQCGLQVWLYGSPHSPWNQWLPLQGGIAMKDWNGLNKWQGRESCWYVLFQPCHVSCNYITFLERRNFMQAPSLWQILLSSPNSRIVDICQNQNA